MDPFEEAQRSERELLEATRRLDKEEEQIEEEQIEEDSRHVGENMRIAFAAADARRTDIPSNLGESTIPPSWWAALSEPRDVEEA